ncbi:MAG: MmcQ/YjbR family DNA-binding protein [Clostridiales bacterium]|nr:MmcQ/YjbR family DNA-binding protein [Clostridiales bacterium]
MNVEHAIPVPDKLLKYGFVLKGGGYEYTAELLDGDFLLHVFVTDKGVRTEVTDALTQEEYTLYKVESAEGSFVGSVRTAVSEALEKIFTQCFEAHMHGAVAEQLILYVKEKYGDELEYLWQDENAVWRRRDNQKWYGALLTCSARKFGIDSDEKVEILDFRMRPEILDELADEKKIFRGYHMNKKHWATVLLNGSVDLQEICALLDESYRLAAEPKKKGAKHDK